MKCSLGMLPLCNCKCMGNLLPIKIWGLMTLSDIENRLRLMSCSSMATLTSHFFFLSILFLYQGGTDYSLNVFISKFENWNSNHQSGHWGLWEVVRVQTRYRRIPSSTPPFKKKKQTGRIQAEVWICLNLTSWPLNEVKYILIVHGITTAAWMHQSNIGILNSQWWTGYKEMVWLLSVRLYKPGGWDSTYVRQAHKSYHASVPETGGPVQLEESFFCILFLLASTFCSAGGSLCGIPLCILWVCFITIG